MMDSYQIKAFELIRDGHNVFITGSGGCGKTFLVNRVASELGAELEVSVTSSTGITALNFKGGRTLFSFMGFSIFPATQTSKWVRRYPKNVERIQNCDLLIIDEISMISDKTLENTDRVLRDIRKCQQPMGGLQVVVCGDFYQLPPVEGRYCFQSPVWKKMDLTTVHLRGQHRQGNDSAFYHLLEAARGDTLDDTHRRLLKEREVDRLPDEITEICSTRAQAEAKNYLKLSALPTEARDFVATVHVRAGKVEPKTLFANMVTPETLSLKVGALVMLTVNEDIDAGLANGSLGVVTKIFPPDDGEHGAAPVCEVDFKSCGPTPVFKHTWEFGGKNDNYHAFVGQVPLILAWSLTIHKSQGSTLDAVGMRLDGSLFAEGMAYVGLSRARSLQTVYLQKPISVDRALKTSETVRAFMQQLKQ